MIGKTDAKSSDMPDMLEASTVLGRGGAIVVSETGAAVISGSLDLSFVVIGKSTTVGPASSAVVIVTGLATVI